MEKPAATDVRIHDLLRRRWSPRAFSDRAVEPEQLRSLLEAARWSASSFNEQPWRYLVATRDDAAEFERMLGCLMEANQTWASRAPVLMLSVARRTFTRNDKPNRTAQHDLGAASANLAIQATALGLFVHQMAGIDREKAAAVYSVPEDFEVVAGIAVGHAGDAEELPEKLREGENAPRARRPLGELVFSGSWERASPLVG